MEKCNVKLDLSNGLIEFNGSEEFVTTQMNNLPYVIELISQFSPVIEDDPDVEELIEKNVEDQTKKITKLGEQGLEIPNSFGEWLHRFQDKKTEQDLALIAAYFTQKQAANDDCNSLEVTKILKEHGHKLSNTSTTLTRLTSKKIMFQTRKEGKVKYLRVSAEGIKQLKELLTT